jgi:TetR/AcrR family transcriptional regulator, repressor for uid operon
MSVLKELGSAHGVVTGPSIPVRQAEWDYMRSGGTAKIVNQQGDPMRRRVGRPPNAGAHVTRQRIIQTAREVFSQSGYDGTTLQEVANRAGLTRPALNYHFANKRVMYHEVIESTYTDVVASAIDRAAQATGIVRQLSVFVEAVSDAIAHDKSLVAFICTSVAERQNHPELRDPDHCPVITIRRFLTWAVNDAMDRGEISYATRVEPLVDTLAAMLSGLGFFAAYVGTPQQMRAITTEIQHLLLTGKLWASTEWLEP